MASGRRCRPRPGSCSTPRSPASTWVERAAGATALAEHGDLLPEETLEAIRTSRVALKGPITTPVGSGFRSINVALRQELDLFAAVRPARSLPGVPTRHEQVDLVVIRENTEDLYQGIEFAAGSPQADALREELRSLAGVEIEPGRRRHREADLGGGNPQDRPVRLRIREGEPPKPDHPRAQGGHHADVGRTVPPDRGEEEIDRGDVSFEDVQIDHLTARLVRDPGRLDVLLLPNLYGDILSDLCAGLVGGLGLVPGANIGWEYAVFEPVHGSAPDIAGSGVADPIAMILSGAMMLRHLGELSGRIRRRAGGGRRARPRRGADTRPRRLRIHDATWPRRSRGRSPANVRGVSAPDRGPEGAVSSRVRRGVRSTPCSRTSVRGCGASGRPCVRTGGRTPTNS